MSNKEDEYAVYAEIGVKSKELFQLDDNESYAFGSNNIRRVTTNSNPIPIPNRASRNKCSKEKLLWGIVIAMSVMLAISFICIITVFIEQSTMNSRISRLKQAPQANETNFAAELQQTSSSNISTEIIEEQLSIKKLLNDSVLTLNAFLSENFTLTISRVEGLLSGINGVDGILSELVDRMENLTRVSESNHTALTHDLINLENALMNLENALQDVTSRGKPGLYRLNPLPSCAATLLLNDSYPSDYYWVSTPNDSVVNVFCDMSALCDIAGGWARVADIDMKNPSSECPIGFRIYVENNQRTCRPSSFSADCTSVMFSTNMLNYSSVCGRIISYQIGETDAFNGLSRSPSSNVDSNYVDGVSITVGSPRSHVWTFAAARDELASASDNFAVPQSLCACTNNQWSKIATPPPQFVGDDYFCDTGSNETAFAGTFYAGYPLWDGAGCGELDQCCTLNNPPWFHKQLTGLVTDDIEMRVCLDQEQTIEDIAIQVVEIYVQ